MSDATSLLFDLPGFWIVSCEETPGGRRIVVMQAAQEHTCPRCGIFVGGKPYDLRESRIKDLAVGHRPLAVVWRKRGYRCPKRRCPQRVFTKRSVQVAPRHRLTGRLRDKLETSASGSSRALSDVAAEYGVLWWSVHRALVFAAVERGQHALPEVQMLGLDETRARSMRWVWPAGGCPTSLVDLDLGRCPAAPAPRSKPGWPRSRRLGGTASRSSRWTRLRRSPRRSAGCFHTWSTMRLANQAVTEVRQRVAREQLGRRGRKANPAWAHRRLLLAAGDRLGKRGLARLKEVLDTDDPTNESGAAWGVKELLAAPAGHDARQQLFCFYDAALLADMPKTTRLAETMWWPAIEAFLRLRAHTEGTNRIIKQLKRAGCSYHNQANYERRIVLHIAAKTAA